MDEKTEGAWIIHHARKLTAFQGIGGQFEEIQYAGKCGELLSALAGTEQTVVTHDRVKALASANDISISLALPTILDELERNRLIDQKESGVEVLGLTTSQTLIQTGHIFRTRGPHATEYVALDLAERTSDMPALRDEVAEYVSDSYRLESDTTNDLLNVYESYQLIDKEDVSGGSLYFNGNLFRHDEAQKIAGVLASMSEQEDRLTREAIELVTRTGCVPRVDVESILGSDLYHKLVSIGVLDETAVGNEGGMHAFVTRPSAFSKFSNSASDDAFDLAKAFVTSLTYGMTASNSGRGRIQMIELLMRKLINGGEVGPATAIGQDYKILELKGVLKLRSDGRGRYYMRLLKADIGRMALAVIQRGEAGSESLLSLQSASANRFCGPEYNREAVRRRESPDVERGVGRLLDDLRTGDIR